MTTNAVNSASWSEYTNVRCVKRINPELISRTQPHPCPRNPYGFGAPRPSTLTLLTASAIQYLVMVEDESKQEEDKLEFTPEGETLGYISLDQARVLAG